MSLNKMPGLGKSGMSRMYSRRSIVAGLGIDLRLPICDGLAYGAAQLNRHNSGRTLSLARANPLSMKFHCLSRVAATMPEGRRPTSPGREAPCEQIRGPEEPAVALIAPMSSCRKPDPGPSCAEGGPGLGPAWS